MKKILIIFVLIVTCLISYSQHYTSPEESVISLYQDTIYLDSLSTAPTTYYKHYKIDIGKSYSVEPECIDVARKTVDSVSIGLGTSNFLNGYSEFEYTSIPFEISASDTIQVNNNSTLTPSPPWWSGVVPFDYLVFKVDVTGTVKLGYIILRIKQLK